MLIAALTALPWDPRPDLPWRALSSPAEKWAEQPTFVIGEYLFILCALLTLVHARRRGRDHVFVWIAALIAGTANDLIFMALPLVDNFWQAQATVMLTPRMPLYIPCVYVCFMYVPTVAAWRIDLPLHARSALSGLGAYLFYLPYDIIGAKFLWWTWHDTDVPIAARLLGAPVSSGLWTLTFVGSFAWLVGRTVSRDPSVAPRSFVRGLTLVAGLTTILMMVQMTILQRVDGGAPAYGALTAGLIIYVVVFLVGRGRTAGHLARGRDAFLQGITVGYLAVLVGIGALGHPETHQSTGIHETPGDCSVEARDITGAVRRKFLCMDDFDEDYTFDCTHRPAPGVEWYTICGRAHDSFGSWLVALTGVAGAAIALFSYLLGPRTGTAPGTTAR